MYIFVLGNLKETHPLSIIFCLVSNSHTFVSTTGALVADRYKDRDKDNHRIVKKTSVSKNVAS